VANYHADTPWTEDKVGELKRLWALGYSAQQIAQELAIGVSRNGVIGKVNRLGLARHRPPAPREKTEKPRRPIPRRPVFIAPKKDPPVLSPPIMSEPAQPKPRRLTILQLQDHHCRWPVEGPPVFKFCGATRRDGGPYCRYHTNKALRT